METVTISFAIYKELLLSHIELQALEIGGVDNWEGYGESFDDDYWEFRKVIEKANTFEEIKNG